jgi:hypothetical protein
VRKSFQAVTGQIHTMPGYSLSEQNTAYVHARNDIRPSRFSEHTGDPRHFYCSMKGGDDQWYKLWSRSSAMQKVFDEKKEDENSKRILERTKISRSSVDEDTLYKMTTLDRNGDIFQDFIHSAKDGFNLVYFAQYFAPDDAVGIAYAMEFTESDGVMIPKYYAHFHGPGGFLTEYQLQESKLNGKLPDDIFTVQALGLKDNDIVVDFQEKVNYMLKNGQLVKLSDFGETPSMETLLEINKPKSSFFGKTAFIVFNILLIALGIYLLFYRKKLKKGNR